MGSWSQTMVKTKLFCLRLINRLLCITYQLRDFFYIFTPQPLRAVGALFSPMMGGWAGGGKIFVWAVFQKPQGVGS